MMMRRVYCYFGLLALCCLMVAPVSAQSEINTLQSVHSVEETHQRVLAALEAQGMRVFAEVDHRANAERVDFELRETRVVIFGNPSVGSPLMGCDQRLGLVLPRKVLIHEDDRGQVLLSWEAIEFFRSRYDLEDCSTRLDNMGAALRQLFESVAS